MKLLYVLASGLLLQACGGGGGGGESPLVPSAPSVPTVPSTPTIPTAPAPVPSVPAAPADPVLPPTPTAPATPAEPATAVTPAAPTAPLLCSPEEQRLSVREFMEQQYFWYTQLRTPDPTAATQDLYFQSMLAKPIDRYSYTQTAASFNQVYTDGRRTGYGYTLLWNEAVPPTLRIRNVEPISPAARVGLQRGDTVLSIDGYTPQQIVAGELPIVSTPGVPRKFVLKSPSGVQRDITVVSEDFPLNPVAHTATLDATRNGAPLKVGYIAYHQFVSYSLAPLTEAFTRFSEAGVSEVILDLRYNGGGSVATARDLGSMLGGARTAGNTFAYLRFNDKQSASNLRYSFNANTPPLIASRQGLPRLVVLTSGSTASASELLINGLRPFMDVVLVGETTFGKPYGFIPQHHCGIFYNAVQFDSLNSAGVGGYTAGLPATCAAPDDLDRQLGDPQERRLKAALDYVATGSCTAPQAMRAAGPPPKALGETTPNQMFAD
jgi:carboxyl-terminal processing protease